jgi:pimeloyl-ACP methyl ester carboxylesterase
MTIGREGDSVTKKPRQFEKKHTASASYSIPAACGIIVLGLAVFTGCSSIPQVPTEHIVMFSGRGNPVDPTGNIGCADEPAPCNGSHFWLTTYHEMKRDRYDDYLSNLFEAMNHDAPVVNGKKRLLIFIHGGLNTQVGTIERATDLHKSIEAAGYFPIFVNWQSSLVSSYLDHLLYIRKGQDMGVLGVPLAPFYLLADVARSVARAPVVWSFQFWNNIRSIPFITTQSETDATRIAADIKREGIIDLVEGDDKRDITEMILSGFSWLVTAPTKLLTAPFIDAFGKSAWDIMLRRTDLLYHTDGEFSTESDVAKQAHAEKGYQHVRADGGLSVFMRRLQDEIARNGGANAWDITLVGHSMGTIVLNRLIHDFGTSPSGTMPFNRIAYMAAAATVKDYEDNIFPYLTKNRDAQFYHLTLHTRAEVRDRWEPIPYVDLPPRGSLLVWVDEFLANPGTLHDRTAGRVTNLTVALHNTPEELRHRIHVKEFNAGANMQDTDPQGHGQFSSPFTFWKQECWQLKNPSSSACIAKH